MFVIVKATNRKSGKVISYELEGSSDEGFFYKGTPLRKVKDKKIRQINKKLVAIDSPLHTIKPGESENIKSLSYDIEVTAESYDTSDIIWQDNGTLMDHNDIWENDVFHITRKVKYTIFSGAFNMPRFNCGSKLQYGGAIIQFRVHNDNFNNQYCIIQTSVQHALPLAHYGLSSGDFVKIVLNEDDTFEVYVNFTKRVASGDLDLKLSDGWLFRFALNKRAVDLRISEFKMYK